MKAKQIQTILNTSVISTLTLTALITLSSFYTGVSEANTNENINYTLTQARYNIPNIDVIRQDGITASFLKEIDDGRPVVLNFIYTSCAAICPLSSRVLSSLQSKLGNQLQAAHFMSISIDPEFDNPHKLMEYAGQFKATPQWNFYTGTNANIKALQTAFNAYRGDKMNHTSTFFLSTSPGAAWTRLDGFASADDLAHEFNQLPIKSNK